MEHTANFMYQLKCCITPSQLESEKLAQGTSVNNICDQQIQQIPALLSLL